VNTRLINTAADVIHRAMEQGRQTPAGLASALESACLLQSPETAAENAALKARRDELEELADTEAREIAALRTRITELEEQRDRRRDRLVALQTDALNMRGILSPNGEARKVPMPLGDTLTPAVGWLINHVAELQARVDQLVAQRDDLLVEAVSPMLALAVPCPMCDAGIDGPCRSTLDGSPLDRVHDTRTGLYELCETEASHPATPVREAAESRPADEDPLAYVPTDKADQVGRSTAKLRALLAGQREQVAAEGGDV
jgi:hypothetical protein